ncbi:hypothetical protein SRABI91_01682 [Rhodococcoides fascians]|nr:hypothetical protein SRABI91_01682 [Rhodococcus fascians]
MRRWAITLCTTDRLWSDRPTIGGDSSAVSDQCVTWSTTFSMAEADLATIRARTTVFWGQVA